MKKLFNEPTSQEREYQRLMTWYQKQIQGDIKNFIYPAIPNILSQYVREMQLDAWDDTLTDIIEYFLKKALNVYAPVVTAKLPNLYTATSNFNEVQFKMIVKANTGLDAPDAVRVPYPMRNLGVDVFRTEPWLEPKKNAWVAQNVSLIKNMTRDQYSELEKQIRQGVTEGYSPAQLKANIEETVKAGTFEPNKQYQLTTLVEENGKIVTKKLLGKDGLPKTMDKYKWRSQLIAQDQILKANSQLTEDRLKSVGVTQYIWRTVKDIRVRDSHRELEGTVRPWSDDPDPGEEVRCRCRAEAVWDDTVPEPVVKAEERVKPTMLLQEAVDWYAEAGHSHINSKLRGKTTPFKAGPEIKNKVEESIKSLDYGIANQTPQAFKAYRGDDSAISETLFNKTGISKELEKFNTLTSEWHFKDTAPPSGKNWDEYFTAKMKGVEFKDKGYVSTSKDSEVVKSGWAYGSYINKEGSSSFIEITGKKVKFLDVEKEASTISVQAAQEKELLLGRNTSFIVDEVKVEFEHTNGKPYLSYKVHVKED